MRSLLLLNGSPRGERSNSMKMLTRVAEGWQRGGGQPPEVLHLARRPGFDRAVEALSAIAARSPEYWLTQWEERHVR